MSGRVSIERPSGVPGVPPHESRCGESSRARVQSVHDDDLTVLAEFHYAGLAMPVVTTLPQPGVERRWQKLPGEPDGPGGDPYTGYDQFGRTVQMRWFKVSGSPETYDPLVSVAWGYNRASLKLWRQDLLAPSLAAQDQLFSYDGLYQVSERERGVLNTGHTGLTGTPAQAEEFGCDETGNWVTYQQNNAGVLDIDQTRENNVSNQVTEIDSSSAGVSYDLNGNMLLVPTGESLEGPPRQLVWDAWNRLRIVKDDEDNVLGDYQYDGRTRRTTSAASGVVRHFYYNDQWRSVEERLDTASTAESQYVWHPVNRWELVLRDEFDMVGELDRRLYSMKGDLDPVAICDTSGGVAERYTYSAFGQAAFYSASYVEQSSSQYGWNFLLHGEFEDKETGWSNYGYRYYVPTLGRWLSRDPIAESGGLNLYNFVRNNPLGYIDSDGRVVWFIVGIAALVLLNPDTANAPGPDDATYSSNGLAGMLIDLGAGTAVTGVLKCCGIALGQIRYTTSLIRAQAARDALAAQVGKRKPVAIGVFDASTGQVTGAIPGVHVAEPTPALKALADKLGGVGTKTACGNTLGCCAEFHGANSLVEGGSLLTNIRFTPAIRPLGGKAIPACKNCEEMFSSNFSKGAVSPETPRVLFIPTSNGGSSPGNETPTGPNDDGFPVNGPGGPGWHPRGAGGYIPY